MKHHCFQFTKAFVILSEGALRLLLALPDAKNPSESLLAFDNRVSGGFFAGARPASHAFAGSE